MSILSASDSSGGTSNSKNPLIIATTAFCFDFFEETESSQNNRSDLTNKKQFSISNYDLVSFDTNKSELEKLHNELIFKSDNSFVNSSSISPMNFKFDHKDDITIAPIRFEDLFEPTSDNDLLPILSKSDNLTEITIEPTKETQSQNNEKFHDHISTQFELSTPEFILSKENTTNFDVSDANTLNSTPFENYHTEPIVNFELSEMTVFDSNLEKIILNDHLFEISNEPNYFEISSQDDRKLHQENKASSSNDEENSELEPPIQRQPPQLFSHIYSIENVIHDIYYPINLTVFNNSSTPTNSEFDDNEDNKVALQIESCEKLDIISDERPFSEFVLSDPQSLVQELDSSLFEDTNKENVKDKNSKLNFNFVQIDHFDLLLDSSKDRSSEYNLTNSIIYSQDDSTKFDIQKPPNQLSLIPTSSIFDFAAIQSNIQTSTPSQRDTISNESLNLIFEQQQHTDIYIEPNLSYISPFECFDFDPNLTSDTDLRLEGQAEVPFNKDDKKINALSLFTQNDLFTQEPSNIDEIESRKSKKEVVHFALSDSFVVDHCISDDELRELLKIEEPLFDIVSNSEMVSLNISPNDNHDSLDISDMFSPDCSQYAQEMTQFELSQPNSLQSFIDNNENEGTEMIVEEESENEMKDDLEICFVDDFCLSDKGPLDTFSLQMSENNQIFSQQEKESLKSANIQLFIEELDSFNLFEAPSSNLSFLINAQSVNVDSEPNFFHQQEKETEKDDKSLSKLTFSDIEEIDASTLNANSVVFEESPITVNASVPYSLLSSDLAISNDMFTEIKQAEVSLEFSHENESVDVNPDISFIERNLQASSRKGKENQNENEEEEEQQQKQRKERVDLSLSDFELNKLIEDVINENKAESSNNYNISSIEPINVILSQQSEEMQITTSPIESIVSRTDSIRQPLSLSEPTINERNEEEQENHQNEDLQIEEEEEELENDLHNDELPLKSRDLNVTLQISEPATLETQNEEDDSVLEKSSQKVMFGLSDSIFFNSAEHEQNLAVSGVEDHHYESSLGDNSLCNFLIASEEPNDDAKNEARQESTRSLDLLISEPTEIDIQKSAEMKSFEIGSSSVIIDYFDHSENKFEIKTVSVYEKPQLQATNDDESKHEIELVPSSVNYSEFVVPLLETHLSISAQNDEFSLAPSEKENEKENLVEADKENLLISEVSAFDKAESISFTNSPVSHITSLELDQKDLSYSMNNDLFDEKPNESKFDASSKAELLESQPQSFEISLIEDEKEEKKSQQNIDFVSDVSQVDVAPLIQHLKNILTVNEVAHYEIAKEEEEHNDNENEEEEFNSHISRDISFRRREFDIYNTSTDIYEQQERRELEIDERSFIEEERYDISIKELNLSDATNIEHCILNRSDNLEISEPKNIIDLLGHNKESEAEDHDHDHNLVIEEFHIESMTPMNDDDNDDNKEHIELTISTQLNEFELPPISDKQKVDQGTDSMIRPLLEISHNVIHEISPSNTEESLENAKEETDNKPPVSLDETLSFEISERMKEKTIIDDKSVINIEHNEFPSFEFSEATSCIASDESNLTRAAYEIQHQEPEFIDIKGSESKVENREICNVLCYEQNEENKFGEEEEEREKERNKLEISINNEYTTIEEYGNEREEDEDKVAGSGRDQARTIEVQEIFSNDSSLARDSMELKYSECIQIFDIESKIEHELKMTRCEEINIEQQQLEEDREHQRVDLCIVSQEEQAKFVEEEILKKEESEIIFDEHSVCEFSRESEISRIEMSDKQEYNKYEIENSTISISSPEIIYESSYKVEPTLKITETKFIYSRNSSKEEQEPEPELRREEEPSMTNRSELCICDKEIIFERSEQPKEEGKEKEEEEINEAEEPKEETKNELHICENANNNISITENNKSELECSPVKTYSKEEQANFELSELSQYSIQFDETRTQTQEQSQSPPKELELEEEEEEPEETNESNNKHLYINEDSYNSYEVKEKEEIKNILSVNEITHYEIPQSEEEEPLASHTTRDISNVPHQFEIFRTSTDIHDEKVRTQLAIGSNPIIVHSSKDESFELSEFNTLAEVENTEINSLSLSSFVIHELAPQDSKSQQSTEGRYQLQISHEVIQEIEPAQEQHEEKKQQINFSISSPEIFSNEEEDQSKTNKDESEDKVELNISKEEDIEIFEKKEQKEDSHVIDSESIIEFSLHTKPAFSISDSIHEVSLEETANEQEQREDRKEDESKQVTLSIESQTDLFDLFEEEIQNNQRSVPLTGEGSLTEFQHLRTEHPIEIGEEIEHSTEQGELPQSIEISPIDVIYESPTKTRRKKSPQNIDFISDVSQVDVAPSIQHLKNILTVNEVAHYEIAQKEDEEPISSLATRRDISNVPLDFEIYTTSTDIYDNRERNQLEINEPRIFDHLHEDLIEHQFELSDLNTLTEIQSLEKSELHISKKLVFEETENENNEQQQSKERQQQQQQLNFSHVVIHELQPVLEDQEHKDLSLIEQNDVIYDQAPQSSEEDREKSLNFSTSLPENITNEEDEQKMTNKVMIDDESIIELEQSENPSFELSDIVHENYSEEDEMNLLSKKFSIQNQKTEFIDNKSEIQGHKQEDQNKAQLYISLQDEFEQVLNLPEMDMSDVHDYSKSEAKQVNVSISPTEIIYESRIVNEQAFSITIPAEVYSQFREESGADQEIKEPKEETKNELHICENANNNINITESNKSELECSPVKTYSKEEEANFELSELSQYSIQFDETQEQSQSPPKELEIELEEEEEPEETNEPNNKQLHINEDSYNSYEVKEKEEIKNILSVNEITHYEIPQSEEEENHQQQEITKKLVLDEISNFEVIPQFTKTLTLNEISQFEVVSQTTKKLALNKISQFEVIPQSKELMYSINDEVFDAEPSKSQFDASSKAELLESRSQSFEISQKDERIDFVNDVSQVDVAPLIQHLKSILTVNEVAHYEIAKEEEEHNENENDNDNEEEEFNSHISREISFRRREFDIYNTSTDIYEQQERREIEIDEGSFIEEERYDISITELNLSDATNIEHCILNMSDNLEISEPKNIIDLLGNNKESESEDENHNHNLVIEEFQIESMKPMNDDNKEHIELTISTQLNEFELPPISDKQNVDENQPEIKLNLSLSEQESIYDQAPLSNEERINFSISSPEIITNEENEQNEETETQPQHREIATMVDEASIIEHEHSENPSFELSEAIHENTFENESNLTRAVYEIQHQEPEFIDIKGSESKVENREICNVLSYEQNEENKFGEEEEEREKEEERNKLEISINNEYTTIEEYGNEREEDREHQRVDLCIVSQEEQAKFVEEEILKKEESEIIFDEHSVCEFSRESETPRIEMSDKQEYNKYEIENSTISISSPEIIYESSYKVEPTLKITETKFIYSQNSSKEEQEPEPELRREEEPSMTNRSELCICDKEIIFEQSEQQKEEGNSEEEINEAEEPKEETKNELHICENSNNNINITESNKSELECSPVETYSKEEEANFELSEPSQYSAQFALLQEPEIRIEEEEEEPEEELPKDKHEIHLAINEGSILEEERYERESSELIISSASIQEASNNDEQIDNEKQPETKNELDISPESIVEQSSKELSCTLTEQESIYDQEPANDGEGINFSISTPEILPLNVTGEKAKRFEIDDESIHAFENGQNEGALNELSINEVADYEVVFDELQNVPSVSREIQNVARREFEIFNDETDIYEERSLAQLVISSASAHENADEQTETKSELAVSQQSVIEKASSESIQLNISSEINEFESQQSSEQQDAETSTEGRYQLQISHEVIQEIEPAQEQQEQVERKQQINFSISSPEIFSNEEEEQSKTNKDEVEDKNKVELNISKEEDIEIFEKKEQKEDSHVIDSESIIEFSLHTKPIFSISSTNHEISLEDSKEDGETSHRRVTLSIENQRDLFDLFEEEIQVNNKSLALEEQESQYIEIKNQPNPIEITSADFVYESPLLDSQEAAEQQPQPEAQPKKSSELQICEAESGNFNNDEKESKIELKCSDIETYSIADTATFELSEPSQNIIRFDPHQIELSIASFEGVDIVSSEPEREAEDGILIEEEEEESGAADASKEANKDKERSIKLVINEDSFNLFELPATPTTTNESDNFEKERSGTELSNDVISFETPNNDTENRPSLDSDSVIQIEQNESPMFDVSEAVHEQRNDSLVRDGLSRMRISSNSQSYEQRGSPALFSYEANDIFSVDQIRPEKENQKNELNETVILESSLPIEFENFFNSQNEISDSLCLSSNKVTNTQISNDIHSFEIQNNGELNGLSISNEIESSFGPSIQNFSFINNVEQFDIVSNVSAIDKNVDLSSKRVDVSISASLSNENLISQNDKVDLIVSPLSLNEVIGVGSDLVLVAGTQLDLPPSDSIVRNEYHGEKLNLVTSLAQEYQVHSDNDSNLSIDLSGQFDQPKRNDELAISPCNGQINIEPSNVILQSNENEQVTIERNHTDLLVNKVVEENQVFEVSSNNDRLNNQLSESYFLSMNIMNSSDDSENSNENEPMKDLNSIIQERNMSIKGRLTIESFDDIGGDYSSNINLLENSSAFTVFDYDQPKEAKNCQINSIEQVSFEPYESLYEIMNINSFDIIPQQDSNIHPIVTDDNAPKKHIKLEVAQPQVNEINDNYNNSNEDTSNNNNNNNNNEDVNNYLPVLSSSRVFHFGFNQLVDVYKPAVVLEISEEALEIDLDISSGPIKAKIEKADQYTINLSNSNPVERNLFIDTNNNNYSIIFSNGLSYSHTESFEAINEDIDNNDLETLSSISPDARLMLIKRQMKEIKDLRSELVKRDVANESIKKKYDNLKSAARECLMKHFSDVRRLTDDNVSLKEQVESLHKLVGSNLDSAQQSILSLMRQKVIASLDFADKITVFEKVPLNRKLTIQGENELEIDRPDIRAGTKVLVTFTNEDVEPNDSEFERFLSKRGISVKEDDQKMHSKSYYKVNKLYLSNLTASVDCRSTFSNLRQTGKVTLVSEPPSYRSFALKVSDSSDTFEKPEPKNEFSFSFYHLRVSRPKFPPVLHLEDNSTIAHIYTPLPAPVQPTAAATTTTRDQGEEKEEKSGNDSDDSVQKEKSIEKVVQKPLRRNIVRNSFFIENDNGLKNFSNDKSAPLNGFYCSFVNASSFSILPQEKPRLVQACNEQFEASAVSPSELHVKKTQAFDFAYEASDETDSDSIEAIVSRPLMLSIPIVHSVASSEEKKKKDRDDNDFEIQISYEFFNLDRNNKEELAIDDASSFYEVSGDDALNADDDNSKKEKLQLSPSIANSFNKKPSAGKKSPKQETLAAENISPNISDNDNKFEKEIYQSEVKDLQISEFDTFEMLPEDNQNDSEMVITMLRRRVTTLNEELKMQNLRQSELISEMAHIRSNYEDLLRSRAQ